MGFQNQRVRRIKVEQIPGYDEWKTTPPDAPDTVAYCNGCGCELYEDDVIYDCLLYTSDTGYVQNPARLL